MGKPPDGYAPVGPPVHVPFGVMDGKPDIIEEVESVTGLLEIEVGDVEVGGAEPGSVELGSVEVGGVEV